MKRYSQRSKFFRRLSGGMVLLGLAAGCQPPGKPNPAERPVMPDQIVNFDSLYASNCAGCHGANGNLGPAPPLNDPLFAVIISEEQLRQVIEEGRPGTPMPAFATSRGGALTNDQIRVLAAGIKSHWKSNQTVPNTPPPYALAGRDGAPAAAGSVERGAAIFTRACAQCHGSNGKGIKKEDGLAGAINESSFLALISDQAIRRIIITGRPDLGMPNFSEKHGRPADFEPLTSADINALVALIADWRANRNAIAQADK